MTNAERFAALFAGQTRAHGVFRITHKDEKKNKFEGDASTVISDITPDLYEKHLAGKQGLGIIPIDDNNKCSFGAIDIDEYNLDLVELDERITKLSLPLVLCRTKSGGAHLYVFLSEKTPASLVRERLMEFTSILGHPGVEVFPKQIKVTKKTVGNWINIPYFNEDNLTDRYAILNGEQVELDGFLEYAEMMRISAIQLEEAQADIEDTDCADAPPCLQYLMSTGFPEGGRNQGLYNLAVYARAKFPDTWEEKLDEFNHKFMQPPLPAREVVKVSQSVSKDKEYFYSCENPPINAYCSKEVCRKRKFGIGSGNEDPDYFFDHLAKIDTAPPMWIADVNGIRIELSTDQLINQDKFRKTCVDYLNMLPRRIKQLEFERLVQSRLDEVEIIEAPKDASPEGQFQLHLETFCTTRQSARQKEEMLLGKVWDEGDHHYFRSKDLMKYLQQERFFEYKERQVWSALRRMGARNGQWHLNGACCSWWSVTQFQRQTVSHNVPNMEEM